MRKALSSIWPLLALAMLMAIPASLRAQAAFTQVTGEEFDSALPKDFYLEGNAIPTQKRNAALLKTASGARVLFALIDTTGYSSRIQQKYEGMIITEAEISICGNAIGVGSYGFGTTKPEAGSDADAAFHMYDQAGEKVAECTAKRDGEIEHPRPLQVVLVEGQPARLYLGRYWLGLE